MPEIWGFHIKGDYVMFVDADDWLEQECVAKLLSFNEGICDILMFPYISEREKVLIYLIIIEYSTKKNACNCLAE